MLEAIENLEKLKQQVEINLAEPLSSDDIPFEEKSKGIVPQIKSRCWAMLLYPDNEYHSQILARVFNDFVCIGALHDSDINKQGLPVKDHYHIVFYFPSAVYASHILGLYSELHPRFLQPRKDVKIQVRYLLHLDSPSKYLYPMSYLEGHVKQFEKYIDKDVSEAKQVIQIIELIETQEIKDLSVLVRLVCDNGLYATYRRNAWTFNTIMSNNNKSKSKGD